ncbi:synaptotagmin-5-like isoform X2 [Carya illinoinensis]|uniref:synaptotagmin-5-like isoform X2 n=1 Tax=Carya illinoinensis TaxID=32201 RepID=UPI001C71A5E9|nr:synaptotagmin-5-like isoform X2 [Carya illinoinensis]
MGRRRRKAFGFDEAADFLHHILAEKPLLPFLIPLILFAWAIERWVFSFSNWVPLTVAVWATIQYGSYQRRILVEDLNEKWKRVLWNTSPITPLEHCEWFNKLLMEVWPNYINPKLSIRFSSIIEKRLKQLKSRLIEKIELLECSLGSSPPSLGLYGIRWSISGDRRIMRLGFDWDTTDMSILLLAKIAKPFMGTARIVINSLHIKGDLLLTPVLDGKEVLYSFVSIPEVRIGVAFGSGGSQSLPATELPGVSSWLVKILTDTLVKTMVEPRRRCYSLPAVDLRKKAVGGVIHVTVLSANKLSRSSLKGNSSRRQQNGSVNGNSEEQIVVKDLQTFVEVELEELTRRTDVRSGSGPTWNSTFNMVLHEQTGTIRFHLYECTPSNVKYDYLASCEIKIKYVADDSTTFWAIGPDSGVIAKHTEVCGQEVEMVIPFEGLNSGELTVRLVLKEWQFSDGSHTLNSYHLSSRQSFYGSSTSLSRTGRKIGITVMEGKDLIAKDKSGKCDPYVKLHYGKAVHRTRTAHTSFPIWNQKFEFDEIGDGEYLKVKCCNEETFGDDNIGFARVNLEGLVEGSLRDVWVPLEQVNSGELRLQIEAVRVDDHEESRVMYKTLNPRWNQTLEFPDDGSPLVLHVKDHNALLPTSSIGDCVVEYQRLPPNQMSDKWIPLQGVKRGEIHIQITRKVPELDKKRSLDSEPSLTRAHQISSQMRQVMNKFQSLIEDANIEELSSALSEFESLEDMQEEYMVQLETEQMLLINKITELGQEVLNSSPSLSRRSSVA